MKEELELEILSLEELENSFIGDAFSMYMKEISSYAPLSIEENKELARAYKKGDLTARDKMIKGNLRLVVNVAFKYRNRISHLHVIDVIQDGNLGLMKAIEEYDPDVGAFSTYAIWWIKQAITRSICNKESEIRKPVHLHSLISKYYKLLEDNRGKIFSKEELCNLLDISKETLDNMLQSLNTNTFSMNQVVGDEDTELESFIASSNNSYEDVENELVTRNLFLAMKEYLNDIEYFVLYYRILNSPAKTLEQLGEMLGVSRERIRQLENKVLKKVKPLMEDERRMSFILNKINEKEGRKINLLRTEPILPDKIIKYLYIKDFLTLNEKRLLHYLYFGKYNYSKREIAYELKISVNECDFVYESLMNKIEEKFNDKKRFLRYRESAIKNYGTKIFSVDLNSDLKIIDYDDLRNRYFDLTYEEIMDLFNRTEYQLSSDEEQLIKRFYMMPTRNHKISEDTLLSDINLTVFGYKEKDILVPKHKLYEVYLKSIDNYNEEQKLFLECYFFNKRDKSEFKTKYKESSLKYRYSYLINRLERTYYNIYGYLDNNFSKNDYIDFKKKYPGRLSEFRIELLDQVYGINGESLSISILADKYKMDYIKMHDLIRNARDAAIAIYAGRNYKLDIDKDKYIPYVKDSAYEFVPETREILSFFLIDDMDYGEIAEEMGLTRYRISNIVTDGIRKIDNYRFGISEVFKISKDELERVFEYYDDVLSSEEKDVVKMKYLYYIDNSIIALELGIDNEKVNRYVRHFNVLYYSYRIKDVTINRDDVVTEVNRHISCSLLNEREKEVASLFYGIENGYNTSGKRYTSDEIKAMLHMSKNTYYSLFQSINRNIKGRKIGINRPTYLYIDRDKLDEILNDSHLPISDKEKEIICYMFELKGYPYKTIYELSTIFGDTRASLSRRYQRAILSIYKYLNNELEGSLNYEIDILPNMKYFSLSDRKIIEKYFKEGISVDSLAKEYKVSFEVMVTIVRKIKTMIFNLLNNPEVKKLDYDYYLKVRYADDLPFYGDLDKTIQIFDLFYGMNDGLRLGMPEVIKKLDLDITDTSANKAANNLMLSVCKYKDGIRKSHTFSYDEIKKYYELHSEEMNYYHKQFYLRYFEKYDNPKRLTGIVPGVSYVIMNDLLRDSRDDYITLDKLDRKIAISLIKKYKRLTNGTKRELMYMFDISDREFMNGKEINHVYRLLYSLDKMLLKDKHVLKKD